MLENIKYYRNICLENFQAATTPTKKPHCVWNICLIERLKLDRARTYRKNQMWLSKSQWNKTPCCLTACNEKEVIKVHCNTSYENTGGKR